MIDRFNSGLVPLKVEVDSVSSDKVKWRIRLGAKRPTDINELSQESDMVLTLCQPDSLDLTSAEAMLRGLPVVATNWSGNVDFLTVETGIPIGYRLVSAEDPQGTYHHPQMQWAEADVKDAATALRRLRADPALCHKLGDAAAQFGARTWSGGRMSTKFGGISNSERGSRIGKVGMRGAA
jgi:glycosyltransferase involved in cell wall biosynthesis